jgi:hypothetical protein
MPGIKGSEREDHHECEAGEIASCDNVSRRSVKIRAAQIKATLRTLQLAAVIQKLRRAVWAEAGSVQWAGLLRYWRAGLAMTCTLQDERLCRAWIFVHEHSPSIILPFSAQKKESQVWLSFDFPQA